MILSLPPTGQQRAQTSVGSRLRVLAILQSPSSPLSPPQGAACCPPAPVTGVMALRHTLSPAAPRSAKLPLSAVDTDLSPQDPA